jgi:hypothetical protein
VAKPMTADQTLAAMKKWNVPYREWAGWKTRGRDPEHGAFSDVYGIVIHHTGSDAGQSDDYLDFLATRGRPGLPGPLCNASTDMDGDLWLIAQGRANHAGSGSSGVFAHVKAGDYAGYVSELKPGPDNLDGNAVYYGNELRYDGGQPPTPKMYAAATRWAAAICDFHGWSALAVIGHREHTTRKSDPGNCPMNKFRADVAALLKAKPVTPTPTDGFTVTEADRVIAHIDAVQKTTEAGRYADLKDTITEWSEAKDNARQKVLLDAINANTKALVDLAAKLPKAL